MIKKMHYHKKVLLTTLLSLSLVYFSACTNTSTLNTVQSQKHTKVGLLFDSFAIARWKTEEKIIVDTLHEYDEHIEVSSTNASSDSATQLKQLNSYIDENYNIIAIVPINPKELISSIKKAKEKGIIVISYDRLLNGCNSDLYLSFDNEYVGTLMAKSLDSLKLNKKKALMISGPETDNNAALVNKGFCEYAYAHNVDIVDRTSIENWKPEKAGEYIENNLHLINNCNIIMCGNDALACSVIKNLIYYNIKGPKYILGQDGDLASFQYIVTDAQYMTVYKQVQELAKKAASIIISLSNGVKLDELTKNENATMINDGTFDIPYIKLQPITINKENIDSKIVDAGIYSHKEVYMLLEP